MNLGTLFSGIGGPEQGALRVYDNVKNVFACEFDKYARQSYEINYDIAQEHFHVDINDIDGKQYLLRRVYSTDGICRTITAVSGGGHEPKIQVNSETKGYEEATVNLTFPESKIRRGRVGKQVAQTLDCACNQAVVEPKIGAIRGRNVVEPYRIRKLTPRECLRLQDFPDTFKQVVSNSQMYKQAGNSMSVNILEMILNQIEKAKSAESTGSLFDFMEDVS